MPAMWKDSGKIEGFLSLCIQGACLGTERGNTTRPNHPAWETSTQKQERKKLKKLQSDIKKRPGRTKKQTF